MTVIDASALVAYATREDQWEATEEVLRESPRSVELLPVEAANAVLLARRRKRLSPREADEALRTVRRLSGVAIVLSPHAPLLESAWEIANGQAITVYDAVYIALARALRTSLSSRDSAQLRAAHALGVRAIAL